jgi:hypothetical protein
VLDGLDEDAVLFVVDDVEDPPFTHDARGMDAEQWLVELLAGPAPEGTTSATCSPWAITATVSPCSARWTASRHAADCGLLAGRSSAETLVGCSLMPEGYGGGPCNGTWRPFEGAGALGRALTASGLHASG